MVAGRPREHDRDQIAKDLIEWASLDDSINVNKFCALYNPPFAPRKLSEWSRECDKFRSSYEIAKSFLAYRREEKLNNQELHVKAYDLNASAYDYIIREREDQKLNQEHVKQSHQMVVNADLAAGASSNIPAKAVSEENNSST